MSHQLNMSVFLVFIVIALSYQQAAHAFPQNSRIDCQSSGSTIFFSSMKEESTSYIDYYDSSRLLEHIKYFSNFSAIGSRVTGYPGCYSSANYIGKVFRDYGLNVVVQKYKVVVPVDLDTSITILSSEEKMKAYTLWPNSIQTSATPINGLIGHVIYVGKGELKDFDNRTVEGSLVLMDFNSGDNWLNALTLGAKGVIFIEPEETLYTECLSKFLDTPIHFPRIYVEKSVGLRLVELASKGDVEVKVISRMFYREIEAENIIGIINGTKYPNDVIIVTAHYDTWSVVPALSHGASESISISSLLEIAKYFVENPPERTTWFVALSGHWEALAGSREFVEEFFFRPEVLSGNLKLWMQINLDLKPEGRGISLLQAGHYSFYGATGTAGATITTRYGWVKSKILQEYIPPLNSFIENLTQMSVFEYVRDELFTTLWWGTEPHAYMLDSEPANVAGCISFSLSTSYSWRQWEGNPLDDGGYLQINGLKPQLTVITSTISGFANEKNWNLDWPKLAPNRLATAIQYTQQSGYIRLFGKVLIYNFATGWYSPLPNALVRVYVGATPGFTYPFAKAIVLTDENGDFEFHGISPAQMTPPSPVFTGAGGGISSRVWAFDAWHINEEDGSIEYAPDLGIYGAKAIISNIVSLSEPMYASVVVVKTIPISLLGVIDPQTLRTSRVKDPRLSGWDESGGGWFRGFGGVINVFDFNTQGEPLVYGSYYNGWEPVAMIFLPKNIKLAAKLNLVDVFGVNPRSSLVLVNASKGNPEGTGFLIDRPLRLTSLNYVKDLYFISQNRYNVLSAHNCRSLSAEVWLRETFEHLSRAEEFYDEKMYSDAYTETSIAWMAAIRAYSEEVMPLIDDTARSCLIFFPLIVLGAVFLERLLFHKEGKKRLVFTLLTGVTLTSAFYFVHPALAVMANAYIALFGTIALILLVVTLIVLSSEMEKIIKRISYDILGVHTFERGTVNILTFSSSIATEFMRKRRFRTSLVLITLITITVALTSLTSISYYTTVTLVSRDYQAEYNGILIKKRQGLPPDGPLQAYLIDVTKGFVGKEALVFPRVWYYPPSIRPIGPRLEIVSSTSGLNSSVIAVLGISPDESDLLAKVALVEGRPFIETDYYSCILPVLLADAIKVKPGDEIKVLGTRLQVVMLLDENILNAMYKDLDDCLPTPLNPLFVQQFSSSLAVTTGVSPSTVAYDNVIILPYQLVLRLGGYLSSLSVRFADGLSFDLLESNAKKIGSYTNIEVYLGWNKKVYQVSRIKTYLIAGWDLIWVALVMGALNITVNMLGNIKERSRETYVFSSTGLPPNGITMMYLVESAAFGVTGVLSGVLFGFYVNALLVNFGLLGEIFILNYASIFIVLAIGLIIAAAMVSTVYPATLAGKQITPSLERKWKTPTKPRGDEWNIPLPMECNSSREALGILEYLREYYLGAGAEKGRFRTTEVQPDLEQLKLKLIVQLAPYEAQTSQNASIIVPKSEEKYLFALYLKRLTGTMEVWFSSNYYFIDDLRKQLLLWKSLPTQERDRIYKRIS